MENQEIDEKITFIIEGKELICNKTNLIRNSEYFRTMFSGNFVENNLNKVVLKEIEYETMEILEKCLWDIEIIEHLNDEMLFKIYKATNMFLIQYIKEFCLNRIIKQSLTVDNCIEIWLLGKYYQEYDLMKRAKFLSVLEFEQIRKTEQIYLMDLETILEYLNNKYLQTDDEINVFHTSILWYNRNYQNNCANDEILLKLIFCLDFNHLTNDNIDEILTIIQNCTISNILFCVKYLKQSINTDEFDDNSKMFAQKLLESTSRDFDGIPCFLVDNQTKNYQNIVDTYKRKRKCIQNDNNLTAVYIDPYTNELKKILEIDANFQVQGFNIINYRQFIYIFGGEEIIGKGPWKQRGWKYDLIRNVGGYFDFPYKRRHFRCCIVDNYLFVIGGFGQFRIYENNLFYYDLNNDTWSSLIGLPTMNRSIECYCYQNHLFLIDIDSRVGYCYQPDKQQSWLCYKFKKLATNSNELIQLIDNELCLKHLNEIETLDANNRIKCNDHLYSLIIEADIGSKCDLSLIKYNLNQNNSTRISYSVHQNDLVSVKNGDTIEYYRVRSNIHLFKSFIIDHIDETINRLPNFDH